MKLAVSTDERTHLVDPTLEELQKRGHNVEYFGPESGKEADWPDVTLQAVERVAGGRPLSCAGQEQVVPWLSTRSPASEQPSVLIRRAKGARTWNHANVLGLSLRATSEAVAKEILNTWFDTPYSDDEWNLRQMQKIKEIEKKYGGK